MGNRRVCVIMAGGSGERFWPLSRQQRPKQLLRLTRPDRNLLEETVARVGPLIPAEDVFIATARHLVDPIRQGGAGVADANLLAEPCKRNTAGCLTWAAARLMARYDGEADQLTMAILSADHLIPCEERFLRTARVALETAEREGALVVIGAAPTRPETGYGYIEIRPRTGGPATLPAEDEALPVTRFREKPNLETAEDFIATGRFLWNTGMFFWTMRAFLDELDLASPAHAETARRMADAMRRGNEAEAERLFAQLEDISIDYALMERARRVVVVRAGFEWDDIGAWDALDRIRPHDAHGNVAVGDPVLIDTRDCVVYNEPGADRVAVALVGVENLAVIVSADGVLVTPKDRAQEVRLAVAALRQRGASQL